MRRYTAHVAALMVSFLAACSNKTGTSGGSNNQPSSVRGSAVQALAQVQNGQNTDPAAEKAAGVDDSPPAFQKAGGDLRVSDDAKHKGTSMAKTSTGAVVTWTSPDHNKVFFARVDSEGKAVGGSVLLKNIRTDEEEGWSPSIVAGDKDFGVAWVDPANGRVRFARVDDKGNYTRKSVVVNEGLEMPQTARLVWTGTQWGVAVGLLNAVYFAVLNPDGTRVGGGLMVHEEGPVGGLDAVEFSNGAFTVRWHDPAGLAATATVSADGTRLVTSGNQVASR